ncbi:UDP-N-acetylmuramoyl-tripeptide--D-alanyl-D-alanine ligase [Chlorobium sp. N1]|uniref:UDP-N-acetylmuramoyl-tripeptide--D-alanyl-D- alanine ligase n=1 Tax=Chlorobium sp. N1 TaxID=2491138 RepID=UPI00103E69C8|nr:UDP-N-acetylmuramoyl-tripeptide--D-alanyl-D-alanine ligase [Chlorobium sp. N1]TCD48182.1 UDP-N-acetylmuramoyl-tripeptide--D-alanyl-D-alanine ligase [Chlorobium sp. N1]
MKGVLTWDDFRQCGELVMDPAAPPRREVADPLAAIDSRAMDGPGIFIALRGESTDGHRYVGEVFRRGADFAMVSAEWHRTEGSPLPPPSKAYIVVDDTERGLQQLATIYRDTFAIPVVGIGGSNGKTTTKEMTAAVLRTGFRIHVSRGNLNNHLGVPLTLLGMRRDTEIAVVEMGINHPGEMELLVSIARPTDGLLTNIGHEHLEFLIDLDGVARAERVLYEWLDRSGGTIFVNADDPRLADASTDPGRHFPYGTGSAEGRICSAQSVTVGDGGRVSFTLACGEHREPVSLRLTGRHNALNAVAAAAVGLHFGLSPRQVREGLEGLLPEAGWKRLELAEEGGVAVINDTYNANPDSMRLAIDTLLDMPSRGRRIAVLGDMLELGATAEEEHRLIGRYLAARPVDMLFTFGELAALACRECKGACRGSFGARDELLRALRECVRPGDTVLFKGSRGMRLEQTAGDLLLGLKQGTPTS